MSNAHKDWSDELKMENLAFYETLDPDAIADDEDAAALPADELTEDETTGLDDDMTLSADDPQAFGETINPLTDLDNDAVGMASNEDGFEDDDAAALADDEGIQAELSRQHTEDATEDDQP